MWLCPEAKRGGARPRPHGPTLSPTAPPPTGGSTLPSLQAWEEWPGSHVGQGRAPASSSPASSRPLFKASFS